MQHGNLTEQVAELIESDPEVRAYWEALDGFWGRFEPRPNRPELFDEQLAFCESQAPVSFLIGGNAAGTTEAAAFKAAQFMLRWQPPPRRNTPFWIISDTFEQCIDTCWSEKLVGKGHIPTGEIEWDRCSWLDKKMDRPHAVPLKPWPGRPHKNWLIQFKSYEQGRRAMQGRSIGGFWFSEQFPWSIFLEVLRGCREYMHPGGGFCEFTPVEPDLCLEIEKMQEHPPPGWEFFRCNTELNIPNLAGSWFEQFFGSVSDEMRDTRMTGALPVFEGVIYPAFNPSVHVVGDDVICFPPGVTHYRGVDWGASVDHPFACVWAYRDGVGDWFVYDEYWSVDQTKMTEDHASEIKRRHRWPANSPFHQDTFADPSRPGEINEFSMRGIPTFPANNDVYQGIDTIRSLLKPDQYGGRPKLYVHRKCVHLIQELRKYRWLKRRQPRAGILANPKVPRPIPLKKEDDTCDALRYCIHTAEKRLGLSPGSVSARDIERHKSVQIRRRVAEAVGVDLSKGILLQRTR